MTNTTDSIFFLIDSYGVAHTTVKCEEYHGPCTARMMGSKARKMGALLICADCEPDN